MEDSMEIHSCKGIVKIQVILISFMFVFVPAKNKWLQSSFHFIVESSKEITLDLVLVLFAFEIG